MNKYSILPVITISFLIAIFAIVIIAKGSLKTYDEISIPVLSSNQEQLLDNEELNTSERSILSKLMSGIEWFDDQQVLDSSINSTYIKYLKEYLSKPGIDLDIMIASEVEDQIKSLYSIMYMEKQSNFKHMSVDGRGVAIYLSKQIYELCGLNISFGMEGDIVQISEGTGNVMYNKEKSKNQVDFQLNTLLITFGCVIMLLSICIIISKKNHLFLKEDYYEEYEEKKYA